MPSPFGHARLIANPLAGRGRAGRRTLEQLRVALESLGIAHDVVETRNPDDAAQRARDAVGDGIRYLVAVGGDGTLSGVVHGLFEGDEAIAEDVVVGAVATGSGADFTRTVGVHLRPDLAAKRLAGPETMAIDVGVVECTGPDGDRIERHFVNCAEVGYGAEVVRIAARLPRFLGRFRYLLSAWGGIRAVERAQARLELAHGGRTEQIVELVVANGQFFGGGMRVAPRALPDDGRFSVLAFTGDRGQVFRLTTQLFHGRHLPNPQISEWQSPHVDVDTTPAMGVEADGEPLGHTPAAFRLLPGALTFKV